MIRTKRRMLRGAAAGLAVLAGCLAGSPRPILNDPEAAGAAPAERTIADAILRIDLEASVRTIARAEEKLLGEKWDPKMVAGSHPMRVRFSPDGTLLAVGLHAKEARVFSAETGALAGWGPSPHLPIYWHLSLAWSPDSKRLFSGGGDHVIWELERSKDFHAGVRGLRPVTTWTCDLDLDPVSGRYLAAAGKEGQVLIWDIDEKPQPKGYAGFFDVPPLRAWREPAAVGKTRVPFHAVAWSPDGKSLAAGGRGGLRIFRAKNDDGTLATTSRTLSYEGPKKDAWDARLGGVLELPLDRTLEDLGGRDRARNILTLDFSPDGKWIASGEGAWADARKPDDRRPLKIWSAADGTARTLDTFAPRPYEARFSPAGDLLAVGGGREVRIYRTDGWARIASISGFADEVNTLDFSPDGALLAVGAGGEKQDKHGDPFLGSNPVAASPFVFVFRVR